MKLFYAITSPYVRKVMVSAHELRLVDRIELVPMPPRQPSDPLISVSHNPLAKIPTLVTDEGDAIYDSVVICEYLDMIAAPGKRLFPKGDKRIPSLVLHALAHGMIDAAMAVRADDVVRPAEFRWEEGKSYQMEKVRRSVAAIESSVARFDDAFCIGKIATACALGYLDFRFVSYPWRDAAPRAAEWFAMISQRPSMQTTIPS